MINESFIFKSMEIEAMEKSSSIVLACAFNSSINPLEYPDKKGQIVELTMALVDISDGKIFGEYSTKLIKYDQNYFWDQEYCEDVVCLDQEDLEEEGLTYKEIVKYIYNTLWFSAYQKPKKVDVLLLDSNKFSGFMEDMFLLGQNTVGRSLINAKYYDLDSLECSRELLNYLKRNGIVLDKAFRSLHDFFGLSLPINTLNDMYVLVGFCYLSRCYELAVKADKTDDGIMHDLNLLKKQVAQEILETSNTVSRHRLPKVIQSI